jgi:hypothetical protein
VIQSNSPPGSQNRLREAFGQKWKIKQASTVLGEAKRKERRVTVSSGVPDRSADATPLPYLFLFRQRLEPLALSVNALPSSCSLSF